MTAQTNDPLNSFAYPQADGNTNNSNVTTTTPTTPLPSNDGTVQTDGVVNSTVNPTDTTQLSPDPAATRGTIITGPDPVVADPSLLEDSTVSPIIQTDTEMSVSQDATQAMNDTTNTPVAPENNDMSSSLSNPLQSTQPTDSTQPSGDNATQMEQEEEHDSPLQALAKKLAKLREELIQEVPETESTNTAEVPEATTATMDVNNVIENSTEVLPSVDTASQTSNPVESLESTPENTNMPNVSLDTPMTPTVDAQTSVVTDTASTDSTSLDAATDQNQTVAQVQPPIDPLASLIAGEQSTLENQKSEESNEVVENSSSMSDSLAQSVPTVPNSPTATSTLASLYPDVVSQVADVPFVNPDSASPTSSNSSESNVLDENDNKMADPNAVEAASLTGKYPISINKIMDIAIERNASDIQVSVGYPVMIRIDGTLVAVNDHIVSASNAEELIMPVLTDQKKELLEVNREVDLAYSPLHNNDARFRINAYYAKGYLTAAFRLIPSKIRTIEELMLPPIYNQLINLSQGLVLVTGPTGHGKSTTLAAMLQAINQNRAVHMLTIEDPIEYMFKPAKAVVDQREMHDDTHSWTVALKSALRQDPDVILVGEMRDYETIASTITLAETGHLVFATLHTNSAAQTVDRIIDVFPENQQSQVRAQLSSILEAVIAQRLIPIEGGGRRAVSEIMLGNPAVRNLIREGKAHQLDNVIRTSADIGMISLEQSLVKLVREGVITMDRAQEFAVHPEEVVRLLKG